MKFSLVFENSGDDITFEAINPDIVEYYIECVKPTNNFWLENPNVSTSMVKKVSELHEILVEANAWLGPLFDTTLDTFEFHRYLDQDVLNLLHDAWVKTQSKQYDIDRKRKEFNYSGIAEELHDMFPDEERFPWLMDVATKIGKIGSYSRVNEIIHSIEWLFSKMRFVCSNQWLEFENNFSKDRATLDICNLYLPFRHLGRTQYNKFTYFDRDLKYDDENTFNQLLKFVDVSLSLPQKIPYSPEYINWCKEHNRTPSGDLIPLGNIPDLYDNTEKYRTILLRNLRQQHKFSLHIKG